MCLRLQNVGNFHISDDILYNILHSKYVIQYPTAGNSIAPIFKHVNISVVKHKNVH